LPEPLARLATAAPPPPELAAPAAAAVPAPILEFLAPERRAAPASPVDTPAPPATAAEMPASEPAETASLDPAAPIPPARPAIGAPPAPRTPVAEPKSVATGAANGAPVECLPPALRAVLADVAARFGPVTTVSTIHLHTENHSPGSTREKLHHACKAVDFKVPGKIDAVIEYLRTRPEVAGINSYRNGVIHIDYDERFSVAADRRSLGVSAAARGGRNGLAAASATPPPATPDLSALFAPMRPAEPTEREGSQ
jgi:hypothetical protein